MKKWLPSCFFMSFLIFATMVHVLAEGNPNNHIINPEFASPNVPGHYQIFNPDQVKGWSARSNTESSRVGIEIQKAGSGGVAKQYGFAQKGYLGNEGEAYLEIDAHNPTTVFQYIKIKPGDPLHYSYYHLSRGAKSMDTMSLYISPVYISTNSNLKTQSYVYLAQPNLVRISKTPRNDQAKYVNRYAKSGVNYNKASILNPNSGLGMKDKYLYDLYVKSLKKGITVWSDTPIKGIRKEKDKSKAYKEAKNKNQILGQWSISNQWKQYKGVYQSPQKVEERYLDANGDLIIEIAFKSGSTGSSSMGNFLDGVVISKHPNAENLTEVKLSDNSIQEGLATQTRVGRFTGKQKQIKSIILMNHQSEFQVKDFQLYTNTILDYQKKSTYSIRVRFLFEDGTQFTKVFDIRILKSTINFDFDLSNRSVNSNQAKDSIIGKFTSNASKIKDLNLVALADTLDHQYFYIEGDILKLAKKIENLSTQYYTIKVEAIDSRNVSKVKLFQLSIKGSSAIRLSNQRLDVDSPVSTEIGKFTILNQTAESYRLGVIDGSLDHQYFKIDGNSLKSDVIFTSEMKSQYTIHVIAKDSKGQEHAGIFIISVDQISRPENEENQYEDQDYEDEYYEDEYYEDEDYEDEYYEDGDYEDEDYEDEDYEDEYYEDGDYEDEDYEDEDYEDEYYEDEYYEDEYYEDEDYEDEYYEDEYYEDEDYEDEYYEDEDYEDEYYEDEYYEDEYYEDEDYEESEEQDEFSNYPLMISLQADKRKYLENDIINYEIKFKNDTNQIYSGVMVKGFIPKYCSIEDDGGGIVENGLISWSFDQLMPFETKWIQYRVRIGTLRDSVVQIANLASLELSDSDYQDISELKVLGVRLDGAKLNHVSYIVGYPDGEFKPNRLVTRAEAATIFSRITAHSVDATAYEGSYHDVGPHQWFYEPIIKSSALGYFSGGTDQNFRPDDVITRGEFIVAGMKYYQVKGRGLTNSPFKDIDQYWGIKMIEEAFRNKIIVGKGDGYFRPNEGLTRAECVTIINKMLFQGPLRVKEPMFKDVDLNHWVSGHVEEAARSHESSFNESIEEVLHLH